MLRMPEEKFREIFPEMKSVEEDKKAFREGYLEGIRDITLRIKQWTVDVEEEYMKGMKILRKEAEYGRESI